jgi:hypothetical protein
MICTFCDLQRRQHLCGQRRMAAGPCPTSYALERVGMEDIVSLSALEDHQKHSSVGTVSAPEEIRM